MQWRSTLLVGITFLLLSWRFATGRDIELAPSSIPLTFASFLTNPPVIENARYEIINPPSSPQTFARFKRRHPRARVRVVLTNLCTLRLDRTNYILTLSATHTYSGRFGSTEWRLMGNVLRLADTRINTPQAIEPVVGNSKWLIRRFLNLGIEQMIPNTLEWPEGADHFTAKCERLTSGEGNTNRGTIEVWLHYSNGVPLTAVAKDSFRHEREIKYRYESTFFDGKFPIGFDVMAGASEKLFSLQITKLQLSENPIDRNEFDPRLALNWQHRGFAFLSNDVPYGVTKSGRIYHVMSYKQAQQNRLQHRNVMRGKAEGHSSRGTVIRDGLIIVALAILLVISLKSFRPKHHKAK